MKNIQRQLQNLIDVLIKIECITCNYYKLYFSLVALSFVFEAI